MRNTIIILLFFSTNLFGQTPDEKQLEKYVKTIDSLKNRKSLEKVDFPDMCICSGDLAGYYYKDKLVYMDAIYSAELGYSTITIYIKDTIIYKIIHREHVAEWGKYVHNYPSDKHEWNPSKMTYSDTLYTITFGSSISFITTARKKIISKNIDQNLIDELLSCGKLMRQELETIKPSR